MQKRATDRCKSESCQIFRKIVWRHGQGAVAISDEYFNYKNKNWLQFLFIVKATVLKQQISKFYPQIQRTAVIQTLSWVPRRSCPQESSGGHFSTRFFRHPLVYARITTEINILAKRFVLAKTFCFKTDHNSDKKFLAKMFS